MSVNIADLIDALPVVEPDEATIPGATIPEALAAELSKRPVPIGTVKRLSLLGEPQGTGRFCPPRHRTGN